MNLIHIDFIIQKCRKLFSEKLIDYGLSWKFLHNYSIIDQILIKIIRIKNIQLKGNQKIKEEKIIDTYIDIINYLIIILIKLDIYFTSNFNKISHHDVILIYNQKFISIKNYIDCTNITFNKFSINDLLKNISYIKKNKKKILFKEKELEKFCFQILIESIFLLKQNF
ncbi:nucleotide modification associated domain-containing protein [Blattabacterium cuenoti]|uniref:nucleotide modification associated domain-containing protein n=1 Tax=Blattabacterium cuenoti TaxID=1653831 RepID=UPI00163BCB8D|nr:nucleotide modification associated domain-containing protein [Blattabacterium cuenoti]